MFHKTSYKIHADMAEVSSAYREGKKTFNHIFDDAYVSGFMHKRIISRLVPLFRRLPGADWMTVGDSSWGRDAFFVKSYNQNAYASGLTSEFADLSIKAGYLNKFIIQNAESLAMKEDSVDFVLCKHTFHHFPRPFVALYEMLRVSRHGVVLIEPAETSANNYEVIGNYVYRVNLREIEKVCRAANLPAIAISWDNSFVPEGKGSKKIDELGQEWNRILEKVEDRDRLSRKLGDLYRFYTPYTLNELTMRWLGNGVRKFAYYLAWTLRLVFRKFLHRNISYPDSIIVILFKSPPGQELKMMLSAGEFQVVEFGPNPRIGGENWNPPI